VRKPFSEIVESFLRNEGLSYYKRNRDPDDPETIAFAVPISMKNCRVFCQFFVRDGDEFMQVAASAGLVIPKDKLASALDFVARANSGLRLGRFQIDLSEGGVDFVYGVSTLGLSRARHVVRHVMGIAAGTYDGCHTAICEVAFGSVSPSDALQHVEGRPPSQEVVDAAVEKLLSGASDEEETHE
jgi:hypothetical protein